MFFSDDELLQVNHSHLLQYYAVGSRCWKELGCIRQCVSSAADIHSSWVGRKRLANSLQPVEC